MRDRLSRAGYRVLCPCFSEDQTSDWSADCSPKTVIVPLLSGAFLRSIECFHAMQLCTRWRLSILPLLVDRTGYDEVRAAAVLGPGSSKEAAAPPMHARVPFLQSMFNRANRIPPDRDLSLEQDMKKASEPAGLCDLYSAVPSQ